MEYKKFKLILITVYTISLIFFTKMILGSVDKPINSRLEDLYLRLSVPCNTTITSGYRSKEDNKRVGGAKHSYHLKNEAIDFVIDVPGLMKVLCKTYYISDAKELGISVILYKKHIHMDVRKNPVYLIKAGTGYKNLFK